MAVSQIIDKIKNKEDILISVVGDSITYGENHCMPEETYTAKLALLFALYFPEATVYRYDGIVKEEANPLSGYTRGILVKRGTSNQVLRIVRSGVGGDTVQRLINRIDDFTDEIVESKNPDLITIMVGINDALQSDPKKYVTDEVFEKNYNILIDMILKRNPNVQLVLLTPSVNDIGTTKSSHLEPYCDRVKKICKERGLPFIDVHKLWLDHMIPGSENFGQRDWLSNSSTDACHPSPIGAEETAKFIFESLMIL